MDLWEIGCSVVEIASRHEDDVDAMMAHCCLIALLILARWIPHLPAKMLKSAKRRREKLLPNYFGPLEFALSLGAQRQCAFA